MINILFAVIIAILLFKIKFDKAQFEAIQDSLSEIEKESVNVDFLAKLTCWRELTHRQRDVLLSRQLGFIPVQQGKFIYPDGSVHDDLPPLTQEKAEIQRIIVELIKDDETDFIFYLMFSRGMLDQWNGRVVL